MRKAELVAIAQIKEKHIGIESKFLSQSLEWFFQRLSFSNVAIDLEKGRHEGEKMFHVVAFAGAFDDYVG
mgnify:FL=1